MREDIYITSHKFGKEFYIRVEDFKDVVDKIQNKYRDLERELKNLKELNRNQTKAFDECLKDYRELIKDYMRLEEIIIKAKSFKYDEDGMDYIWKNTENL